MAEAKKVWDLTPQAASGRASKGAMAITADVIQHIMDDIKKLGGQAVSYKTADFLKVIGYSGDAKISTVTWGINRQLKKGRNAKGLKSGYEDSGKRIVFRVHDWTTEPEEKDEEEPAETK